MSAWSCPHELRGRCLRVPDRDCDPGMKGCVLFGRFRWSVEAKNRPPRRPRRPKGKTPEADRGAPGDAA